MEASKSCAGTVTKSTPVMSMAVETPRSARIHRSAVVCATRRRPQRVRGSDRRLSLGAAMDLDLGDARESLAYWERRSSALPLRAVRARREAREMTARWHGRVAEAERAEYGRGLLGALLLIAGEGRLPATTRGAGRTLARHARRAALLVLTVVVALTFLGLFVAVELVSALLGAL